MQHTITPIFQILPPREGFSPKAFGAVSLSAYEFSLHSAFRERIHVIGQIDAPAFEGVAFEALRVHCRFYERATRAYARAIAEVCRTRPPALIEVHNRPQLALMLRARLSSPLALHLHNDPQEMRAARSPRQRRHLLRSMNAIYCVSEWVKARLLEGICNSVQDDEHKALQAKITVVPCGITRLPKAENKQKQVLYVGRMTPNKGVLECAEGMKQALSAHPDWRGILIGGRRHAASEKASLYEQRIEAVVARCPQMEYRGFQPFEEAQAAFSAAAIVVVPSLWDEPFGRTALEALNHGCAVISSGRGGLAEILGEHGGLILRDISPSSIAAALGELMGNHSRLEQLQQEGYKRAALYSIEHCAATLDAARHAILS